MSTKKHRSRSHSFETLEAINLMAGTSLESLLTVTAAKTNAVQIPTVLAARLRRVQRSRHKRRSSPRRRSPTELPQSRLRWLIPTRSF